MDSSHRFSGYGFAKHRGACDRPWNLDDGYGDAQDEAMPPEPPPARLDAGERRLQVRAYTQWARLLGDRRFPSSDDFDPSQFSDFCDHAVLLDVRSSIGGPKITFLGAALSQGCDPRKPIRSAARVPRPSLLSRLIDVHLPTLVNEAPVGFESQFVDRHGKTILYRGILLPFSRNDRRIDYVLGVINGKELLDPVATIALLRELDGALRAVARSPLPESDGPVIGVHGAALQPDDEPALAEGAIALPKPECAVVSDPAPRMGYPAPDNNTPLAKLAGALRALPSASLSALGAAEGREREEFTLLVARRKGKRLAVLGEVREDAALVARLAARLLPQG